MGMLTTLQCCQLGDIKVFLLYFFDRQRHRKSILIKTRCPTANPMHTGSIQQAQGLLALLLTCTHQSLVFESCRYIFTADPRGKLKLWRLCNPSQSASQNSAISNNVSLIAEFISSFNIRIMCLDASSEEEVFSFYHVSNLIRVRIFLFMV